MNDQIEVGQVWRKEGPHGWIRIERILTPSHQNYDGGFPGATITSFPPQVNGIQMRGGKQYFIGDSQTETWQEQIKHNRFLLKDGWRRGDSTMVDKPWI